MAEHTLKIEMPYYEAVRAKIKNFEIRIDDRGYQKGDTVVLCPITAVGTKAVGLPRLLATIGYVTAYKQLDGFVVFSLLKVKEIPA